MATGKSTHVALDQHALLRIIEEAVHCRRWQ